MKWLLWIAGGLGALVAAALALVYATGNGALVTLFWAFAFGAPDGPFDPSDVAPAPDYSDTSNWAALPDREDLADLVPPGAVGAAQGEAPVDAFFVHPTGFLKGSSWTFSMDPNTSTEENTRWMMANQASPYNGCCNVYAPRYRQASIYAYFSRDPGRTEEVLGFAYQDVERAFDYFIEHYSNGRPFVLASHSQGTHHSVRLLQEKIAGTELADRLVAAYVIGGGIARSDLEDLPGVALCDSPEQTGCAIHWDTWSVSAIDNDQGDRAGNLCTNPLTWRVDGGLATSDQHVGAVRGSGEFHPGLSGSDAARGVEFGPLEAPLPNFVEAQCKGGALFITDQSDTPFGQNGANFGGGNYHGLDYPIFHMDIRENAIARAGAWLAARAQIEPVEAAGSEAPEAQAP